MVVLVEQEEGVWEELGGRKWEKVEDEGEQFGVRNPEIKTSEGIEKLCIILESLVVLINKSISLSLVDHKILIQSQSCNDLLLVQYIYSRFKPLPWRFSDAPDAMTSIHALTTGCFWNSGEERRETSMDDDDDNEEEEE